MKKPLICKLLMWTIALQSLLPVALAQEMENAPLTLDNGTVIIGASTFGLVSFATGSNEVRPALYLRMVTDGERADSLKPAIRSDVSLTRSRQTFKDGRIAFLESVANHGTRQQKISLRWTAYLPDDQARLNKTSNGWRSESGWQFDTGVAGQLRNGWPGSHLDYPGHDPGYIGWEIEIDIAPRERKAVMAILTPPKARAKPAVDWLSEAQFSSLIGWKGHGGRGLVGGKRAPLAVWLAWRRQYGAEALIVDTLAHSSWLSTNHIGLEPLSQLNPSVMSEARKTKSDDRRPLAGLPVAIKDIIDVAGLPTLALSEPFPRPANRDALLIARLRKAGAIILGKTTYDEDFGDYGMHRVTGRLRGLFHPDVTVTGSSGGSAISVATGIVPLAIGSDTCGSLGTPASHAGVAALRPSIDLFPYEGARPLDPRLDTLGPIVANVADLPAIMRSLLSSKTPVPKRVRPIKLGLIEPWPEDLPEISPEVERQFARVVERLRAVDVILFPVNLQHWTKARAALRDAPYTYSSAQALKKWLEFRNDQRTLADLAQSTHFLQNERKELMGLFTALPDAQAAKARQSALDELRLALTKPLKLKELDGLIMPATLAWPGLLDMTRPGAGEPSMCPLAAYTGLPQITVPIATEDGEPSLGAAIIGHFQEDRALINLAVDLAEIIQSSN